MYAERLSGLIGRKRSNLMLEEAKFEPEVYIDVVQERERPRLVATLFFDFSNQTVEGKHNLIGVFDRIFVSSDRKRTHSIGIYIKTAYTFDGQVQVAIFSPSNKPTGGFAFASATKEHDGKPLTQMQILGTVEFDTPEPGDYWFDVSYKGQSLGGVKLVVEFVEPKEGNDVNTGSDN